jgi:mannose-6-phosphate isomerase-like protein (cupin superfamily)
MPSDTHADLVLDRFWDTLVDDPMAGSDDLDLQAAASLRRLHAMASAPAPTVSRERVRHRLSGLAGADHEHAAPPADRPMPLLSLRRNAAAADGHLTTPTARSLAAPQAIHGARRWTAILATAAIVLLALAASIRGLSPAFLGDDGKAPAVSAPNGQSGVTQRMLLDIALTAEESAFSGQYGTQMGYFSSPPGSHDVWPSKSDGSPEARVVYIMSGSARIKSDQPLRVVRGSGQGTVEQMTSGTWFVLDPGDSLLRAPGVTLELENPGTQPYFVLDWTIGDVNRIVESEPSSWTMPNYTASKVGVQPNDRVRFTLRLVTLAKDAVLSAPTGALSQQYLDITSDQRYVIGQDSDYSITNRSSTQAELYVVTLEPVMQTTEDAGSGPAPDETLLDVVLPEEQLQTPGRFNSIMGYYSIPAGSQDSWSGPTDTAPEPLVWHVLSGTYAVRADQDVQVTRAGASGKTSVVAAGNESTLGPGDTLVRPAGALMELANDGTEPVLLVVWTLGDINVQGPSLPSSWDSLPCYPGETSGTAPSGPVRLKLRLVTVTPGSTLSAPAGAFVQQFLDLTSEAPNLGQKSDYSLINQGTEPVTLYVVSLEPASPDEATPVSST